jgi:hypothetical protein
MAQVLSGCWVLATAIFLTSANSVAFAQVVQAPLNDGFVKTSSIAMSVDEMLGIRKVRAAEEPILGPGYPALWIGEVQFKPLRLIRLSWTDAATGKTQQEIVRYMVYRMIRRDYTELAGAEKQDLELKLADPETDPSNVLDADASRPLQMPRFVLQADESDGTPVTSWQDEVNVSIQNAVFAREMGRRGLNLKLFNSVEGLQEIGTRFRPATRMLCRRLFTGWPFGGMWMTRRTSSLYTCPDSATPIAFPRTLLETRWLKRRWSFRSLNVRGTNSVRKNLNIVWFWTPTLTRTVPGRLATHSGSTARVVFLLRSRTLITC